jgi:hypothetical protein
MRNRSVLQCCHRADAAAMQLALDGPLPLSSSPHGSDLSLATAAPLFSHLYSADVLS